jgi:hypothetical protein
MKTYTVHSGTHRATPISLGLWIGKHSIRKTVVFDASCRYHLNGIDQLDINKLFGIGFLVGGHHKDSARFGWRWDVEVGAVEIFAYCYVSGKRAYEHLGYAAIGKKYSMGIIITDDEYLFDIDCIDDPTNYFSVVTIPFRHNKWLSYPLGVFFGGNQTAPHDIKISME